jgi:hypothetical protein
MTKHAHRQDLRFFALLVWMFLKDTLGDRYCGKNVRPAGVEEQVGEHLRGFRLRQTIIHCPVEVSRELRHLP